MVINGTRRAEKAAIILRGQRAKAGKLGRMLVLMPVIWSGLGLASIAHAQRYIEVWNPPEARLHGVSREVSHEVSHDASHAAPRNAPHSPLHSPPHSPLRRPASLRAHPVTKPLARKVTQVAGQSDRAGIHGTAPLTALSKHRPGIAIPRKLGPDGRVFQV